MLNFEHKTGVYELQETNGKITGIQLYKVANQSYYECWSTSPEEAIDIYLRVKKSVDKGYYSQNDNKSKKK